MTPLSSLRKAHKKRLQGYVGCKVLKTFCRFSKFVVTGENAMDEILKSIVEKKARLDRLRPLPAEALANLEHYFDIELTYTSNAIEGNTLSAVETTLVIEQGVTIGGKPLKDHLEALDHYDATRYVRELAWQGARLTHKRCAESA